MKKYRVHMRGHSMTANYEGYVDIYAEDNDDAPFQAKHKLTKRGGAFSGWSPDMFEVLQVRRLSDC